MHNPFRKSPSPLQIRARSKWVRTPRADELQDMVEQCQNTVILGVEGSGKSTLLNMFFNNEYCLQAAQNGKLIFFADLSDTENGQELCQYLIAQLQVAATRFLSAEESAALLQVMEQNARQTLKQQFILACQYLYAQGYTLLLVMDGFERFVSSPHIKQDQHDMLCSLLDRDIMFCVVATNYDLEKTSLPPDIQGSLYLQKFQAKIIMRGFSEAEAGEFITKRLSPQDPIQIDTRKLRYLLTVTGGIPSLFELAASHMYDLLVQKGRVINSEIMPILYRAAKPTMQRWFKHFTPLYQVAITTAISEMPKLDAIQQIRFPISHIQNCNAAARLRDRGFWVDGKAHNTYAFNSLLLQSYTATEYLTDISPAQPMPVQPVVEPATAAPQLSGRKRYNIFISYKRTDRNNELTKDAQIAQEVYRALSAVEGFVPFLDIPELPRGRGGSCYNESIHDALDSAQIFIFICTQSDFLDTPWVKHEWDCYTNEMYSGRKPKGSVYGVLDDMSIVPNIPLNLRNVECFSDSPEDIKRLIVFLKYQMFDGQDD